jgi:hypothetical protein
LGLPVVLFRLLRLNVANGPKFRLCKIAHAHLCAPPAQAALKRLLQRRWADRRAQSRHVRGWCGTGKPSCPPRCRQPRRGPAAPRRARDGTASSPFSGRPDQPARSLRLEILDAHLDRRAAAGEAVGEGGDQRPVPQIPPPCRSGWRRSAAATPWPSNTGVLPLDYVLPAADRRGRIGRRKCTVDGDAKSSDFSVATARQGSFGKTLALSPRAAGLG